MPLTDVAIRNAKPKEKPYKLGDTLGLFLLVQPSGGKLWRLKYRFEGREKKLAIGTYRNWASQKPVSAATMRETCYRKARTRRAKRSARSCVLSSSPKTHFALADIAALSDGGVIEDERELHNRVRLQRGDGRDSANSPPRPWT